MDELESVKRTIREEFSAEADRLTLDHCIISPAGFICMDPSSDMAHVAYLYVHPSYRGEGYVREFLQAAREQFAGDYLLTLRCRPGLVEMYEHLGFQVDPGAGRNCEGDDMVSMIEMDEPMVELE